ncbi:MAG: hypothetical protein JWM80_3181, partial [Cyanobacteria bacterium RYN_339]|nr:hypothetical protein [Cyanobacteria bacterium RYN_339]
MFKHRSIMVAFADVSAAGGRPVQPPVTPPTPPAPRADLAATRTRTDAEHERVAGGSGPLTRQAFVNDRLQTEGGAGDRLEDSTNRLAQEFDLYDADGNNDLSADEFANLVQDRVQRTGDYDMNTRGADAHDLTAGDRTAMTTGITERGDAVRANQGRLNEWLSTTQGQDWAHSAEGRSALGPSGHLTADGLEGPRTRAVMQAVSRAAAPTEPAGGAAPAPAAAAPTAAETQAAVQRIRDLPADQLMGLATSPGMLGQPAEVRMAMVQRLQADQNDESSQPAIGQLVGSLMVSNPNMLSNDVVNNMSSASIEGAMQMLRAAGRDNPAAMAQQIQAMPESVSRSFIQRMVSEGGSNDESARAIAPIAAALIQQDPSLTSDILGDSNSGRIIGDEQATFAR